MCVHLEPGERVWSLDARPHGDGGDGSLQGLQVLRQVLDETPQHRREDVDGVSRASVHSTGSGGGRGRLGRRQLWRRHVDGDSQAAKDEAAQLQEAVLLDEAL